MKWQPTPVFLPEKSHGQQSLGATAQRASGSQWVNKHGIQHTKNYICIVSMKLYVLLPAKAQTLHQIPLDNVIILSLKDLFTLYRRIAGWNQNESQLGRYPSSIKSNTEFWVQCSLKDKSASMSLGREEAKLLRHWKQKGADSSNRKKKMLRFALKLEEGIPSLTYFAPTTGRITI